THGTGGLFQTTGRGGSGLSYAGGLKSRRGGPPKRSAPNPSKSALAVDLLATVAAARHPHETEPDHESPQHHLLPHVCFTSSFATTAWRSELRSLASAGSPQAPKSRSGAPGRSGRRAGRRA